MKGGRTRIFLISPSWIIRTGLSHIIGKEQDLEVVDSASDLSCLSSSHLASLHPQVIVLDPSASSAAGIHSLRSYYVSLNEYIVIGALNAAYPQEIIEQFDSCFTINDSPSQIVSKIRSALTLSEQETDKESPIVLSAREIEILTEVAKGLTNKEIADRLSISVFTVTTHRKNITQKLGIHSIAGLTVYAVMNHLIDEKQIL